MIIYVLFQALIQQALTGSEYRVLDESGAQVGTFLYNSQFLKRDAKRDVGGVAAGSNIISEDDHKYYSSQVYVNNTAWMEINPAETVFESDVVHEGLSSQFRYAYNIRLPFVFPFYGLPLTTITPTTGGFIFVGELIHNQLTETQYIAPLMAEFDPSLGNNSFVYYYLSSTKAIVQWDNVYIHSEYDFDNSNNNKPFTFQVQLHINGDILFAYKEIPYHPKDIDNSSHYVRVGIAEAYYEVDTSHGMTVTYVHQYHSIDIDFDLITNYTEVLLAAERTCLSSQSCADCTTQVIADFQCNWCHKLQQCSDGVSRWRQNWKDAGCDNDGVGSVDQCPNEKENALPATDPSTGFYEMVLCQESKTAIVCAGDDTLLIDRATFSRTNYHGSACESHTDSDAVSCEYDNDIVTEKVAAICDDQRTCFVQASENLFGSDPCPLKEKTLNIYYKCNSHTSAGTKVLTAFIVIVVVALLLSLFCWGFYAYRNPTTPSGLFLIKYGRFWNWKSSMYKEETDESGI